MSINSVTVSAEDLIVVIETGYQTRTTIAQLNVQVAKEVKRLRAAGKPALIFVDLSAITGHDQGAELEARGLQKVPFDAMAIFTTSRADRVIINMLITVTQSRHRVRTFKTLAEAHDWLTYFADHNMTQGFYTYDPRVTGSKGLVYIGDDILVYRRDSKTRLHPLELDVPGGGVEGHETPFQTFRREVREEFGLAIARRDIHYARLYPSTLEKGRFGYFAVAHLPESAAKQIIFGDEGTEYYIMKPSAYVQRRDGIAVFQKRTTDYLRSHNS